MRPSVVLSGPMFSGKSTMAGLLRGDLDYAVVSARSVLRELAGGGLQSRADLQQFGATLEERTRGRWLGEAAAAAAHSLPWRPVVVDAARTLDQVVAVREVLDRVEHVHVTAPEEELKRRFAKHTKGLLEAPSFEEALAHPIEQAGTKLGAHADLILDSGRERPQALLRALMMHLQG